MAEAVAASSPQVDLFGQSLIGDLLDATENSNGNGNSKSEEVDLFADAAFVSAGSQVNLLILIPNLTTFQFIM